jgi:hypothetical protein
MLDDIEFILSPHLKAAKEDEDEKEAQKDAEKPDLPSSLLEENVEEMGIEVEENSLSPFSQAREQHNQKRKRSMLMILVKS